MLTGKFAYSCGHVYNRIQLQQAADVTDSCGNQNPAAIQIGWFLHCWVPVALAKLELLLHGQVICAVTARGLPGANHWAVSHTAGIDFVMYV